MVTAVTRWPIHPAADLFPEPTAEEYTALRDDIRANGVATPIVIYHDQLLDGRTRLRACEDLGIECPYREWEGESPVSYAVSLNLKRRHLTSGHRMRIGVEMMPLLHAEASERKRAAASRRWDKVKDNTCAAVAEVDVSPDSHRARDVAAKLAGVSNKTIDTGEMLKTEAPALYEKVGAGKMTKADAVATLRREKQAAERKAVLEATAIQPDGERRQVKVGDWWQLGEHLVYCGDTSTPTFIEHCPEAAFAFADPPYGVGKAEWDNELIWEHDWLADKAKIVVVTPGIANIHQFAGLTEMPYRWSLAAYITNGKTRGAIGFSNWIYMGAYSKDKVFRQRQDATTISIHASETVESTHKSRKPAELLSWLLDTFTSEGDLVIDPFLGSGTTLLAAQSKGRRCVGGELEPEFVDELIGRWEALTKQRAVKVDLGRG